MADVTYEQARSRAEKLVDSHVKERVIRGMELLKREMGEDWVEQIDCASLNLRNGDSCILGQLYGDYQRGVEALFQTDSPVDETINGFCIYSEYMEEGESYGQEAWESLDEAWHEVLACE